MFWNLKKLNICFFFAAERLFHEQMMADDVDMEKVAEKVPVVPNETSAKSDKMFSLKRWNAVAMWSWGKTIMKIFSISLY